MKKLSQIVLSLSILFFGCNSFSQDITAETGSYGIDKKNKIIVWHVSNLDSIVAINTKVASINFEKPFTLKDAPKKLSYTEAINVNDGDDYALYITKLPLIHININDAEMNSDDKIPGYFTYFNDEKLIKSTMGVRFRGNLSLSFPKKSFDLEFWTDSISKEKKDVKFKGMRSDDDWILDGMFNEPLRLRSDISAKLWSKIHEPYYAQQEPKAKSGFDVKYVEVFKNNQYHGLYQLSESVDRKQLKLKKNVENTINGELFKANSYKGGPDFTKFEKYNNLFPHWIGWKTEYPIINYESDWKSLSQFQDLVVNGTDDAFSREIASKVNIDNVIDYYLYINVIRASDNVGKNYYLAKYNKGEPYFFVTWDVDGVMGIIQDGKRERAITNVLSNGLFKRLIEVNPNGYKEKLKNRWTALRAKEFSNEVLLGKIDKIYTKLTEEKIYEREQLVWQNKLNEISNEEHYSYLKTWLEERLNFLDTHFKLL